MIDREKVIAGLKMLADRKNDDTCEGLKCCKIAEDALALLKEQEPVIPEKYDFEIPITAYYSFECKCTAPLMREQPYCMKCGRPVKWND